MKVTVAVSRNREPVFEGKVRVRGLWARRNADGSIVYELQKRVDGKMRRLALKDASTKTEAIRAARALTVGLDEKTVEIADRSLTLRALCDDFLRWERSPVGSRASSTLDLYELRLTKKVLPFLGPTTRVEDLTVQHVRRLIASMKLEKPRPSGSSMRGAIAALSAALRHGVINLGVSRNVVRELERGEVPSCGRQSEPRIVSPEDAQKLLAAMSDTYRPVASACLYGALRVSEALSLTWADVDFAESVLRVPGTKTKASKATISLAPALARELLALRSSRGLHRLDGADFVFQTATGKALSRRNVLRAVNDAGDAAGLNEGEAERIGCHDLRHSAAAAAFSAGLPLNEVADLLRHSSSAVTASTYDGLSKQIRMQRDRRLVQSGFGA